MNELLLLLLPVAAASGWWAARRSADKKKEQSGQFNTPAYFQGLNHLLNEEPDKAIDVFVQMLEVDSETVETHLALGSLFRRRGEVERAIRIHQNLIARPALSREQRAQALLELGQDYMRAGLYDRAENLFIELRDMKLYEKQALKHLRTIYQQEKDWEACLRVAEHLEPLLQESLGMERSHYFCELALEAQSAGEHKHAQSLLKKALSANRECIRPIHLQADFAISQEDCRTAIKLLKKAGERDPDYLPEILPTMVECYKRLDDLQGLRRYLEDLLPRFPYLGISLLLADLIRNTEGEASAESFLGDEMQRHPSLRGLLCLVQLNAQMPDRQAADVLTKVRSHIERLLEERPTYQCTHCGFEANTLHWQCPSCRKWSTIRRKPDIEEKPA